MMFLTLWRKWIRECIGTTSTSVLVNGCPTNEFLMEKGLRQGNPPYLSPFLFVLAAEGFHVLMESLTENDPFVVSHFQFVGDTLICLV